QPGRRGRRGQQLKPIQRPNQRTLPQGTTAPPSGPPMPGPRASIAPSRVAKPPARAAATQAPAKSGTKRRLDAPPPAGAKVDHKTVGKNVKEVMMHFDKRDLAEVIQFVSDFTQRNFILPERVGGKITILSNAPIPADEVWNVFVAALDANNWALYPVGHYWKLAEKKQATRANIPLYLERDSEPPANEQMVTKLF